LLRSCRPEIHECGGGLQFRSPREKVMSIEALALEGDEQRMRRQGARIRTHGVEFAILTAQFPADRLRRFRKPHHHRGCASARRAAAASLYACFTSPISW